MSELLTSYIFANDFTRFGYKIIFRNETSQTYFLKDDSIAIKQLKNNGIILEIPNNQCQKGHTLTLFLFDITHEFNFKKSQISQSLKDSKFEIIAKVDTIEPLDNLVNQCSLNLTFIQYDVKGWNRIIEMHEKKQEQINDLIAKQFERADDE